MMARRLSPREEREAYIQHRADQLHAERAQSFRDKAAAATDPATSRRYKAAAAFQERAAGR